MSQDRNTFGRHGSTALRGADATRALSARPRPPWRRGTRAPCAPHGLFLRLCRLREKRALLKISIGNGRLKVKPGGARGGAAAAYIWDAKRPYSYTIGGITAPPGLRLYDWLWYVEYIKKNLLF